MTQPPDDRPPRPDEPEGEAAPENAPTVAWTPPESGWQTPGQPAAPGVPPPVPPGGGWEVPTTAAAMPQQEGYVIAGVGARIVAWLIDVTIAVVIPGLLTFLVVDWSGIIRQAF